MSDSIKVPETLVQLKADWKKQSDQSEKRDKLIAIAYLVSVLVGIAFLVSAIMNPATSTSGFFYFLGIVGFCVGIGGGIGISLQEKQLVTVATYKWWVNLNGESSGGTRTIVEEILSFAEGGGKLNDEHRIIVAEIASASSKEFKAGQVTSNSQREFGMRALKIILKELPEFPTTR